MVNSGSILKSLQRGCDQQFGPYRFGRFLCPFGWFDQITKRRSSIPRLVLNMNLLNSDANLEQKRISALCEQGGVARYLAVVFPSPHRG
jgi:hypothetical protein